MASVTHMAGRGTGKNKLLITHTDLDGVGCAAVFLKCYPKGSVVFADYKDVNLIVNELIDTDLDWDVMISDISVDEETAARLDKRGRVSLLDHHDTARWLQDKYSWAVVDTTKCGTRLVYELLSTYFHITDYANFVDIVEDWDLWGKGTGPGPIAVRYNFLLYFLSKFRFLERVLKSPDLEDDSQLAEILYEQYETYYNKTKEITQIHEVDGLRTGITIADQHASLMGSRLCEELDLEYVMMLDPRDNKGSLRGRGNIHLGELARNAGGGGHRRAAGFPLGTQSALDLVTYTEGGA